MRVPNRSSIVVRPRPPFLDWLLTVFRNWFDCQFHSTLIDLADEPLIEEEI